MRFLLPIVTVAGLLLACSEGAPSNTPPTGPSFAASATTERTVIPFTGEIGFNGCTNEDVVFNGDINVIFHVTQNAAGGLVMNGQANFQGITAVGESSGITYHLAGRSVQGFDGPFVESAGGGSVNIFVFNQVWVSEGSSPNLSFRVILAFVVNPNGDVTADVLKVEDGVCKG